MTRYSRSQDTADSKVGIVAISIPVVWARGGPGRVLRTARLCQWPHTLERRSRKVLSLNCPYLLYPSLCQFWPRRTSEQQSQQGDRDGIGRRRWVAQRTVWLWAGSQHPTCAPLHRRPGPVSVRNWKSRPDEREDEASSSPRARRTLACRGLIRKGARQSGSRDLRCFAACACAPSTWSRRWMPNAT